LSLLGLKLKSVIKNVGMPFFRVRLDVLSEVFALGLFIRLVEGRNLRELVEQLPHFSVGPGGSG